MEGFLKEIVFEMGFAREITVWSPFWKEYLAKGLDKQLCREIAKIVYLRTALHTIKYFLLKPTKYYK